MSVANAGGFLQRLELCSPCPELIRRNCADPSVKLCTIRFKRFWQRVSRIFAQAVSHSFFKPLGFEEKGEFAQLLRLQHMDQLMPHVVRLPCARADDGDPRPDGHGRALSESEGVRTCVGMAKDDLRSAFEFSHAMGNEGECFGIQGLCFCGLCLRLDANLRIRADHAHRVWQQCAHGLDDEPSPQGRQAGNKQTGYREAAQSRIGNRSQFQLRCKGFGDRKLKPTGPAQIP